MNSRGQARAAYGKRQLEALSEQLTRQFGKGFDGNFRTVLRLHEINAGSKLEKEGLRDGR